MFYSFNILVKCFLLICGVHLFVNLGVNAQINPTQNNQLRLWLTINAMNKVIEVSWINAPLQPGDRILITNNENDKNSVILEITPTKSSDWIQTNEKFNKNLNKNITISTKCYGYWVYYLSNHNETLSGNCIHAYPKWMNDLRPNIEELCMRDLMIPATHDSGSYKANFNPSNPLNNNPVTKYSLTQDDDIWTQLMHGIRHLDIRVGYYKFPQVWKGTFYITHGPTKQIKLIEAIQHVKNFVKETNEIVIFDVHEFTNGFDEKIHTKLVNFLRENFGNILIDPSLTWNVKLSEIWAKGQNVFLSYNHYPMVYNNKEHLFNSVSHRWANKIEWNDVENFMKQKHQSSNTYFTKTPVADMAALTISDKWDIILDKHGGLRKMANSIKDKINRLYREELGKTANVVAVDFYRSTNIVDISIDYNYAKIFKMQYKK